MTTPLFFRLVSNEQALLAFIFVVSFIANYIVTSLYVFKQKH